MAIKVGDRLEVNHDNEWLGAVVTELCRRLFWVETDHGQELPFFYYEHRREWRKDK